MSETFPLTLSEMPRQQGAPWGAMASVGLHLALAVALIVLSPLRQLVAPPPPDPVAVEIVTPAEFDALTAPRPAPPAAPIVTAPGGDSDAGPPSSTVRLAPSAPLKPALPEHPTVTATQFYSTAMLREPGMAHIRKTLTTLADSERVVQLCNIEGLEQIRKAAPEFDPDTLVSYAMADPVSVGLTVSATGGAFRSRRKWYGIAFRCTAAADYSGIVQFQFKLGEPIPPSEWDAHNLTAAEDEAD